MLKPRDPMNDDTPDAIWNWVNGVLDEVSDEIGKEANSRYLLVYEGWGGLCVESVWDPAKPDDANEGGRAGLRGRWKRCSNPRGGCGTRRPSSTHPRRVSARWAAWHNVGTVQGDSPDWTETWVPFGW